MLCFDMLGTSGRYALFRRLALVVAFAQGLLYAAAPFAEAQLDRAPARAGIERSHSPECTRLHQPDKCAFCQLATARARRTDGATLRASGRTVLVRITGGQPAEPQLVEPCPTRSRAPPTTFA